jgi:ferredoxin
MAKTISYSDFLKEGALQEQVVATPLHNQEELKPFRIVPEDIANDTDEKAFWKRLRHFYRTGERPQGRNGVFVPALIAPYLQQGNWETEYPYYLAHESSTSQSLEKLLDNTYKEVFKEDEAKVLKRFMPKLNIYFKESLKDSSVDFKKAKDVAIKKFLKIEVHDEDGERFKTNVEAFNNALPVKGHILSFHHETPLLLIKQKLEQIEWNRNLFKTQIKETRDRLLDRLNLNAEKSGKEEPEKGFEFASDMIALGKVQDMQPELGSRELDENRISRIKGIINKLDESLEQKENTAHVLINNSLSKEYRWKKIFDSSTVSFVELSEAFDAVQRIFDKNIKAFTAVLINMRKAELELKGKYDDAIHDDFFDHFKWFKLEEEELNIFPPVVLFTHSNDLLDDGMSMFSKLMVANKPINVVALKDRTVNPTDPNIDWEDASISYRQELAANALSHRNVHTLQCAADRPGGLLNGIRAGMNSIAPSLMHILVPSQNDEPVISFLKINAAAAGRYFPYLMYDPHKGLEWGSRFDVLDNSHAELDWPIYPFTYSGADENEEVLLLAFTYADYKAMNKVKVEELFMVPESMVNDYLVPLQDYLKLHQNDQTGKVPFIWLIDEDNCMVRAAVPYMWVESCQERLDFWNFLQELGGLNNYHAKVHTADAKASWDKSKRKEIEELKAQFEKDLAKASRESAGIAMEKLASILLDLDQMTTASKPTSNATPEKQEAVAENPETEVPIKAEEPEEDEPSEAWIETFRCTSCNDCTDRFPAIFAYNEEKQAFVKDASKGTFEHIVLAAESCPAACIHPGAPLNPKEDNIEELIERAAKFN